MSWLTITKGMLKKTWRILNITRVSVLDVSEDKIKMRNRVETEYGGSCYFEYEFLCNNENFKKSTCIFNFMAIWEQGS